MLKILAGLVGMVLVIYCLVNYMVITPLLVVGFVLLLLVLIFG
jgi:hypothetical protein